MTMSFPSISKSGPALLAAVLFYAGIAFQPAQAGDYVIDSAEKHSFIQFKVSHLGFSYILGDFPDFEGTFSYDSDDPDAAKAEVVIDTTSADTRHAERNIHIRGDDFLDVKEFPTARFVSTGYEESGGGEGTLNGELTLRGVTRPVSIALSRVGEGEDPWGNYRAGFEGTATITMADYGIDFNLGPTARTVEIYFTLEGIES